MKAQHVLLVFLLSNSIAMADTTCDLNGVKLEVSQTENSHTMILTGVTRPPLKSDSISRVVVSFPRAACQVGAKPFIFTCLQHDEENNYGTIHIGKASLYNAYGALINTISEELGFVETRFTRSVSGQGESNHFTVSLGGDESPAYNDKWRDGNQFNVSEADLLKQCK